MEKLNDGGPAFPLTDWFNTDRGPVAVTHPDHPGMSLRDYFAATAVSAFAMTHSGGAFSPRDAPYIARFGYAVADAMLKERATPRPGSAE